MGVLESNLNLLQANSYSCSKTKRKNKLAWRCCIYSELKFHGIVSKFIMEITCSKQSLTFDIQCSAILMHITIPLNMHAVIGQFSGQCSPVRIAKIESWAHQTHVTYIINILPCFLNPYYELRILRFLPLWFMTYALYTWAINQREKNWSLTCSTALKPG